MSISIKTNLVPGSIAKKFRTKGRVHHNIRIYLATDNQSELDDIDAVKYELHPSFKERIRLAENRSNNFEVRIWSYGYFRVNAKIFLKSGNITSVEGFVKW